MSDLFHQAVPEAFIRQVFAMMGRADWHGFQILTKRAERLAALSPHLPWRPHIWMGVSVESIRYVSRLDPLRQTGAHVKFLSLEPLLGPLSDLDLRGIDWVIVGGESGPGARPMHPAWAVDLRDQCQRAGVPFFFKQWGGVHKHQTGCVLDGRTWDEMPALPGHVRGRPPCIRPGAAGHPTPSLFPEPRSWRVPSARDTSMGLV